MVDLVLEDAGLEPRRLEQHRSAGEVDRGDPRVQGPLDVDDDVGEAQAALLGDDELPRAPLDLRVDDGAGLASGPDLEDEHAPHQSELGGGEADPERPLHEADHPLGLTLELGAELGHLRSLRLQDRVAELADLAERLAAPLESLLVELRVLSPSSAPSTSGSSRLRFGHAPILGAARSLGIDVDRERDPRSGPPVTPGRVERFAHGGDVALGGSRVLISSRRRKRPRRRKRGAGPSSSRIGPERRPQGRGDPLARRRPAAASAGPVSSTAISEESGG